MKYFQEKTGGKHKMKKKIVSMLLVAAMVASMAVGCGSKNDSGSSDTKSDKGESITFMDHTQKREEAQYAENEQKEETGAFLLPQ